MGQQSHPDDRVPRAPHLPHPYGTKEVDQAEHPSASHPGPAPQTVQEVTDAMVDRMDMIVDELKKLLQQIRTPK